LSSPLCLLPAICRLAIPGISSRRPSKHFFDIRQFPCLVEEGLLRAVEAEEDFEFSIGVGRDPVGFFAGRGFRSEVDIYGTVAVLLQSSGGGGAAGPLHVADEGVGLPVVGGGQTDGFLSVLLSSDEHWGMHHQCHFL
jgi:hypothetical protein